LMVSQMLEGENAFHFSSKKDDWMKTVVHDAEKLGILFSGPLDVDLKITKLEPDFYLKGELKFSATLPCARCAESVPLPVKHGFELALAHVTASQARHNEAALAEESDELDINFFQGNEIALGAILAEQIVLSIPYKALCRPDCRGICQSCGKNLNQGDCACVAANPLNPFTALKQLKQGH